MLNDQRKQLVAVDKALRTAVDYVEDSEGGGTVRLPMDVVHTLMTAAKAHRDSLVNSLFEGEKSRSLRRLPGPQVRRHRRERGPQYRP